MKNVSRTQNKIDIISILGLIIGVPFWGYGLVMKISFGGGFYFNWWMCVLYFTLLFAYWKNGATWTSYTKDSFDELLNKVSWPTWEELQNSAVVVAVASLIIALIIFLMDSVFSRMMELFYDFF
tara:strand:- start:1770 stop:2141 length:372 start_codon:yes stop_codon:yes gene_type:complete